MLVNSLSGRFLMLTIVFVMIAEVLIFVPSVARFREDYLLNRLEHAQIASFSVEAGGGMIEGELEDEILADIGVFNVALLRDDVRELVLSRPIPEAVHASYDLRDPGAFVLIRDAFVTMLDPQNRVIRVIGDPGHRAGTQIEVTTESAPLRDAMIDYGLRILYLSGIIAAITALLLFLAVQRLLVAPIRRVVSHMTAYAEAPEDSTRIIKPTSRVTELREAEEALHTLQTQLSGALRQRQRLAQLGAAVARISHDLRNILATASLFADRMEQSDDPAVARAAPKLVASLSRAATLCESTLAFGKAEEPPPRLSRIALAPLVADVVENEQLAGNDTTPPITTNIAPTLVLRADPEQLYRVVSNLVRNARQAIEAVAEGGAITIEAGESDEVWWLRVRDTGPGLPEKARANLFAPFQGNVRKGGVGLGLPIAAELVRGHGGRLDLERTGPDGTSFTVTLPKSTVRFDGDGR